MITFFDSRIVAMANVSSVTSKRTRKSRSGVDIEDIVAWDIARAKASNSIQVRTALIGNSGVVQAIHRNALML